MTRAPRRWLDGAADAPPGARDLLRAAGGPDPAARLRVWEAVRDSTAGAGTATAAAGATAAKGAAASGGALALTGAKASVLAALMTAASLVAHRSPAPSARPSAPAVAPAARAPSPAPPPAPPPSCAPAPPPSSALAPPVVGPSEPAAAVASARRAPARRAPARPAPVAPPVGAPVAAPAPLGAEGELAAFSSARAMLDRDPAAALVALDALDRRLDGGGVLAHERARYAIEALRRLGRGGEARARADGFLRANPASTVAPAVRALRENIVDPANR